MLFSVYQRLLILLDLYDEYTKQEKEYHSEGAEGIAKELLKKVNKRNPKR